MRLFYLIATLACVSIMVFADISEHEYTRIFVATMYFMTILNMHIIMED